MKWVVKNAVRRVKFMLMIVNYAKNSSSSSSCSCFSSQFSFYVFFSTLYLFLWHHQNCRYFYITSRMFNGFNAALLVILGATWAAKWQRAGGAEASQWGNEPGRGQKKGAIVW